MTKTILFCLVLIVLLNVSVATMQHNCPNVFNWNGKRCECPVNMVNLNGKCICDYGYWAQNNQCKKCDKNNKYIGKSCLGDKNNCQDGYVWSGTYCKSDWSLSYCQDSGYWNGLTCVNMSYPLVCEPGFTWNGEACILLPFNGCDEDNFFNGNKCLPMTNPPICLSGFTWSSLAMNCIKQQASPPKCSSGYWNGVSCKSSSDDISCAAGCYWNGGQCRSIVPNLVPSCLKNYFWSGQNCQPADDDQQCDDGFTFNPARKACMLIICEDGLTYDSKNQACNNASVVSDSQNTSANTDTSTALTADNPTVNTYATSAYATYVKYNPRQIATTSTFNDKGRSIINTKSSVLSSNNSSIPSVTTYTDITTTSIPSQIVSVRKGTSGRLPGIGDSQKISSRSTMLSNRTTIPTIPRIPETPFNSRNQTAPLNRPIPKLSTSSITPTIPNIDDLLNSNINNIINQITSAASTSTSTTVSAPTDVGSQSISKRVAVATDESAFTSPSQIYSQGGVAISQGGVAVALGGEASEANVAISQGGVGVGVTQGRVAIAGPGQVAYAPGRVAIARPGGIAYASGGAVGSDSSNVTANSIRNSIMNSFRPSGLLNP